METRSKYPKLSVDPRCAAIVHWIYIHRAVSHSPATSQWKTQNWNKNTVADGGSEIKWFIIRGQQEKYLCLTVQTIIDTLGAK